jgi:hypothetical protein
MITFKAINKYSVIYNGKTIDYYKLTFVNGDFKILTEEDFDLLKQEVMCDDKNNMSRM